MHYVLGTAGHIDHGKSAIVKALTGTDPDRLKEEKERGMTTDLGFAFLGDDVTIIDVPGHEKFIRHMLAGASTIDLVLLVVAADDGVMPQTKEHFEICRLLGIKKGLIAINKIDLVDEEWLELVRLDVQKLVAGSFLENAPIVMVSALTGQGIPELKKAIQEMVERLEPKPDRGIFRLPVDRSFRIKGFGTIVAGTVLSGVCRIGDRLELLPQGFEVRVRGIQKHNQPVEQASIGDRAALNLQGVEAEMVERGSVLVTPNYYRPTEIFNATCYLLKDAFTPLRHMTRVHLHIGTAEVMCQVCLLDKKELAPGEEALVQIRTEKPIVCDWNDRYVIRHYSPPQTIGGGLVLEANAIKERRFNPGTIARLKEIASGEKGAVLEQYLLKIGFDTRTLPAIARELTIIEESGQMMVNLLLRQGKVHQFEWEGKEYLIHQQNFTRAKEETLKTLSEFHQRNPWRLGIKRAELRAKLGLAAPLFEVILKTLIDEGGVVCEGEKVRLASHQLNLTPIEKEAFDRLALTLEQAKWSPPSPAELLATVKPNLRERIKIALLESGVAIDLGDEVWMHFSAIKTAEEIIKKMFESKSELTTSEIRQALNTTRKFIIPLLNYFDTIGVTQRKGEVRILRSKEKN